MKNLVTIIRIENKLNPDLIAESKREIVYTLYVACTQVIIKKIHLKINTDHYNAEWIYIYIYRKNAPNKYLKKCRIHEWCRTFLYLTTTCIILSNQFREQTKIGHFRVPLVLCIKTRLSAQPLIWKWFFILMQIQHSLSRKAVHLALLWKWGFPELGRGLLKCILVKLTCLCK